MDLQPLTHLWVLSDRFPSTNLNDHFLDRILLALNLIDPPSHIPFYLLQPMAMDDLQAFDVIHIPELGGNAPISLVAALDRHG